MTVWPAAPLPLPPVERPRAQYRLHESGALLIGTGYASQISATARLGEIYLELYTLDLFDPAAIVRFANRYGTLSGPGVYWSLRGFSWWSHQFSPDLDRQIRELVVASDPPLRERTTNVEHPEFLAELTTLESFRFAANVLVDLTDAWLIANADPLLDASKHEWRLSYPVEQGEKRTRLFAYELLITSLPALLGSLHPHMVSPGLTDDPAAEEDEMATPSRGVRLEASSTIASFVHLAQFCALELFNHIVGSEAYRQCANENCRRPFVRQYGRSRHGQSRRERVLYCSRECAQAVAARMYRRRKRAREHSN